MASERPAGATQPANAADFAYESLPVEISANGTYTLDFGPISQEFASVPLPQGFAWEAPWDIQFQVMPIDQGLNIVTINGQQYLQGKIQVSDFQKPYTSFEMWIS